MRSLPILLIGAAALAAQNPVAISVDAAHALGPYRPIFGFFGYDEPNYTYTSNGRKLVGELGALSGAPVFIRTHFLLATGDGTPGLKWGSTNAYTEDESGKAVYDWTITDRIFDTYLQAGARPFVEIGFMPQALSTHPEPYRPEWIPGGKNTQYNIGWTYPPKNYKKWAELVYQWVRHAVAKFGRSEAAAWYWEVWNEPDIGYWHGSPEEYDKLYDFAADAVKRALPEARVGGPATTGPANERAAKFLRQFLEHCAAGTNYATGRRGAPLDFITFHAKGRPEVVDGRVRMGIAKNLADADAGFRIATSIPKFRALPIVLSESDPEGCAACSARVYPENAYRNGSLYPAYTAAAMKGILDLAERDGAHIAGMLTWAFEFEDQPYFDGLRTLATHGIDKPILNLFRMDGMMRGERVKVESAGAAPVADLTASGVRGDADVDAIAVRGDREISILVWNYHDDAAPAPEAKVAIHVAGIPGSGPRVLLRHYRIDDSHSNAYPAWKRMESPANPNEEQQAELERAGQLQMLESPRWIEVHGSGAEVDFTLPRHGVSLLQLAW